MNEGRIDVYPKKGKYSGAFCTYGLIIHPTYSLLNWTDKLNDVLTFAHEMGHLVDWLPTQTLKRGNLLGRLATLESFRKGTFTDANGWIVKDKALLKGIKAGQKISFEIGKEASGYVITAISAEK